MDDLETLKRAHLLLGQYGFEAEQEAVDARVVAGVHRVERGLVAAAQPVDQRRVGGGVHTPP